MVINAGKPTRTVSKPFTRPTIAPTASAASSASGIGQPAFVISQAQMTAHKPATEPTDKSISPAIIRSVMPTATAPVNDMPRNIAPMFAGLSVEGLSK